MRPEKHGTKRTQLSVGILEEAIAEDAFARVLDLFVDRLGDENNTSAINASRPKINRSPIEQEYTDKKNPVKALYVN